MAGDVINFIISAPRHVIRMRRLFSVTLSQVIIFLARARARAHTRAYTYTRTYATRSSYDLHAGHHTSR